MVLKWLPRNSTSVYVPSFASILLSNLLRHLLTCGALLFSHLSYLFFFLLNQTLALEKAQKYRRPKLQPDKASAHFPKIATHLLQALLALDPLFGWLQTNQQKALNELMSKEKTHPPQLCLDTIRIAIACVPIAMTGVVAPELLNLLCRYLVHLDKRTIDITRSINLQIPFINAAIQEAAYKTLYLLVSKRPDLRSSIVATLADFAFSIPDKQHELIYVVLHKA